MKKDNNYYKNHPVEFTEDFVLTKKGKKLSQHQKGLLKRIVKDMEKTVHISIFKDRSKINSLIGCLNPFPKRLSMGKYRRS